MNCHRWLQGRQCRAFKRGRCPGLHPPEGPNGEEWLYNAVCHRFLRTRCFDDEGCKYNHFTYEEYRDLLVANAEAMPPGAIPQPVQAGRSSWDRPPPPPQPGAVFVSFNGVALPDTPQPGAAGAPPGPTQQREVPAWVGRGLVDQTSLDLDGMDPAMRPALARELLTELEGLAVVAGDMARLTQILNSLKAYLRGITMH